MPGPAALREWVQSRCCRFSHGNDADIAATTPSVGLARCGAASAQAALFRRNRGRWRAPSGARRRSDTRSFAAETLSVPCARRAASCGAVSPSRAAVLHALSAPPRSGYRADWLAPGERGLDDLRIEELEDGALLAFLHLSEKSAATDFASYRDVLQRDPPTRAVFEEVLWDEAYHMNYTLSQLVRVSARRHRRLLWRARLSRLWKGYLRLAIALAGIISGLILTILYFTLLVPFALLAKRVAWREPSGWLPVSSERNASLDRQY